MTNFIQTQFQSAIERAAQGFNSRLEQQRLFQIQNYFLNRLHTEVKQNNYCASKLIEDLSIEYEEIRKQLTDSGKTYEHIIGEKTIVDTYGSLEKFLSDCFHAIYYFFPKFLGQSVTISIGDLFINSDIEACKMNVIEMEVKAFIQKNNIKDIINGFDQKFRIKKIREILSKDEIELLFELSLVRNVIIHNNGIINRIYTQEACKKISVQKYNFLENMYVIEKIDILVDDIKIISGKVCNIVEKVIIDDYMRLNKYHDTR